MPVEQTEFTIIGLVPLSHTDSVAQAQALRLCVFMNVLQTIYCRAFAVSDHKSETRFDKFVRAGHDLVTVLLFMGVLKEGADAIRDFESHIEKVVSGLAKGPIDSKPIGEAWARLKRAIDKGDTASLWNQHLKHARDKAAFHWARGEIEKACKMEAETQAPYVIFRQTGAPLEFVRFILADEVLGRIAFPDTNQSDIGKVIEKTRAFATDVIQVLGTVLSDYFRERGCKLQPFTVL